MPSTAGAFFDVDETLVRVKSMFHFLEFYLRRRGEPEGTYDRLVSGIRAAAADGVPREQINRAYYRFYGGESAERLAAAGDAWFEHTVERELFIPETVAELAARREAGDFTVLVSGSFFACLDPIAAQLRADWTFGTRPVIRRGVLTGEVVTPVIGPTKARIARTVAAVRGLDLGRSSAYGDHASDLELLGTVGRPVVVGDDPVLAERAAVLGWRRLRTTAEPARV
jgi:HAD superfamily hydrolase (TIGR01490 family)